MDRFLVTNVSKRTKCVLACLDMNMWYTSHIVQNQVTSQIRPHSGALWRIVEIAKFGDNFFIPSHMKIVFSNETNILFNRM